MMFAAYVDNPSNLWRRVWFVEVQLLVQLDKPYGRSTSDDVFLDSGDLYESALVQYYGLITSPEIGKDKVEKFFNFARLR